MHLTERERAAVRLYAEKAGTREDEHSVVREPKPGVWYDWAHPETGRVGQCRRDGAGWAQAPADGAVILAWKEKG